MSVISRRDGMIPGVAWEPSARWVRAEVGGVTVANSRRTLLVWQQPGPPLPAYAFPKDDVRMDLLTGGDDKTAPEQGDTVLRWTLNVVGRSLPGAAWSHTAEPLSSYVSFAWSAMDHWYEEAEEVFVHPRDPHHRVDMLEGSRNVRVEMGGEVVANSTRLLLLFETSLPTRYYLHSDDIRMDLLTPTELHTRCPYKGVASYWSVRAGAQLFEDIAWGYPEPIAEAPRLRGRICFLNESVDLYVDDELQERPQSPWSKGIRAAAGSAQHEV